MSSTRSLFRRGVFAAAVLGTLGFGATQALATPAASAAPPTCNEQQCDRTCRDAGFSGGFCLDRTSCNCF